MVEFNVKDNELTIAIKGRLDSTNAPETEEEIMKCYEENSPASITIDCADLEYISSAGLRIIMKLKKRVNDTKIINVSSSVYEVFEVTGFSEIMEIHKALRTMSVEGLELIGRGAKGAVYRIDPDTIVKAYNPSCSLEEIDRTRELSRAAFVLGVPTAIPFDLVKIENGGYGTVYELLQASTLAKELSCGNLTIDETVKIEVNLLKTIHSTEASDTLPPAKDNLTAWMKYSEGILDDEHYQKLCRLINDLPDANRMIHGDFHLDNIMYMDGEPLLIDMDSIGSGHPIIDLNSIWCTCCGFSEIDHNEVQRFLGIPYEESCEVWNKTLSLYLGTDDQTVLTAVENKTKVIGYTRIIRRTIKHNDDSEIGKLNLQNAANKLTALLDEVDTLDF